MLAIDWSHTKGLTTYNGKECKIENRKDLLKRLSKNGLAGESTALVKSMGEVNPSTPLVILEQGCPPSLVYDILKTGSQVKVISNRATQDYRVEHNIEKTDETDARIIYELSNNGANLTPVSLDDKDLQLLELYQRYKRYQKARVAMTNMKKAYVQQFGDGESRSNLKSTLLVNPSPALEGEGESITPVKSMAGVNPSPSDDTLPYDTGIDTLKASENSCLKKIVRLAPPVPETLKIKGLGPRLWAGIYITANPANFPTLSSYLRYCGLVNLDQLNHKWNRHARMLYHMLADEVMKHRDEEFRPVYDKCKADIAEKYPDYTKLHIHNGALNRTATFLAKKIWRVAPTGESIVSIKSKRHVNPVGTLGEKIEHNR